MIRFAPRPFALAALALPLSLAGVAQASPNSRDCHPSSSDPSTTARVLCEDTGEEYFFGNAPERHPSAPSWICSTVTARLSSDSADANEQGSLRTVSVESREERDRRTQLDDLLAIASGEAPRCWKGDGVVVDNPRARAAAEAAAAAAEAERQRIQAEADAAAERKRQKEEAERIARVLRPHRRPPRDATDDLIRSTTPARVPDSRSPRKLDLCIAIDRSASMAPVMANLRSRFSAIEEAWAFHYPEGIRVTVVGFGQSSADVPYSEQILLTRGSTSQVRALLSKPFTLEKAGIETTLDAVAACAGYVGGASPRAGIRTEIVLMSDEGGNRVPETPKGSDILQELQARDIQLEWINPRNAGCPRVLSTESTAADLEAAARRIQSDRELLLECTPSLIAFHLWKGKSDARIAELMLNLLLAIPPGEIWDLPAETSEGIASILQDSYKTAEKSGFDMANWAGLLDDHLSYLETKDSAEHGLNQDLNRFVIWGLLELMEQDLSSVKSK